MVRYAARLGTASAVPLPAGSHSRWSTGRCSNRRAKGREWIEIAEAQDPGIGIQAAPFHDHGSGVGRLEAVDGVLRCAEKDPELLVLVDAEGEGEILRGEGHAVLPGQAIAEPVGGLHAA